MSDRAGRLREGVREAGIPLVTAIEDALAGGVVIVGGPAESRREVCSRMYDEHGIAGSTSGGFRLSPHLYSSAVQAEGAPAGLKAVRPLIVA